MFDGARICTPLISMVVRSGSEEYFWLYVLSVVRKTFEFIIFSRRRLGIILDLRTRGVLKMAVLP